MKKALILVVVLVFVAMAGVALADVANSRHNLSASGTLGPKTNDPAATVCGFCHIPHGGDTSIAGLPLWSRDISGIGPYAVYGDLNGLAGGNGATLSGTTVEQPGANSLTCLSCHDGTVGLGVTYKNGVQATNFAMIGNGGFVTAGNALDWAGYVTAYNPVIGGSAGDDLMNDHPVGIVYTPAATFAGLDTVANAQAAGFRFYNYPAGRTNSMECGSCHDPHDASFGSFLRVAPASLCQGCHVSK